MSTATAEKTEKVKFLARSPNLIVTRIPEDIITDARGRQIDKINRQREVRRVEEENRERLNHALPPKPIDDVAAPWKIEFGKEGPAHTFETDNPVLIEFLRGHELFNNPTRGFWEIGNAPGEPKPSMTEQNVRLNKATALGDKDEIEAVLQLEKETHNRTAITEGAEAALAALRELEVQTGPAGDDNQTEDPSSESGPAHN